MPIIVLCGYVHAGTSYVADLLIKHGADPGVCYDAKADYDTHENLIFRAFCSSKLGIETKGVDAGTDYTQSMKMLLAQMGEGTHLLKYPKSVALLNDLAEMCEFKTVFVTRPWDEWKESYMRRTGLNQTAAVKYRLNEGFFLNMYAGQSLVVNFRSLMEGRGVDDLLRYVGLT